jgi:mycothiol synthase
MTTIDTGAGLDGIRVAGRPDLRFRRWAGLDDVPAMVRVSNAARDAAGVIETADEGGMANQWTHPVRSDPARDSIVAEIDGELVGYGSGTWEDYTDGGRAYDWTWRLHPDHWGRGITSVVILMFEARLREVAEEHGPVAPRWFATYRWEGDRELAAALPEAGYAEVRRFYDMVRPTLDDLPDAPTPEGLEVRPVLPEHLRPIFEADNDAFRDHFGGIDLSDEYFAQWTSDPHFDPSLWQVAWDGDRIAGLVINTVNPAENERHGTRRFWLDSVATLRPWRRRGLARALMVRSMAEMRDRHGMTSAALGVDTENPNQALKLYQDLGFETASTAIAYRKPF